MGKMSFMRRLLVASSYRQQVESTSSKALVGLTEKPSQTQAKAASVQPQPNRDAMVDGFPVRHYAKTHKDDLAGMLACCQAIESVYWPQGESKIRPDPFFFERAAILSRKSKDYAGEVSVCVRWIAIENNYMQDNSIAEPLCSASSRLRGRLSKARLLSKEVRA